MNDITRRNRQPVGFIDSSGMPMPMPNTEFSTEFSKSVRWVFTKAELDAALVEFEKAQKEFRDEKVAATFEEATRAAAEDADDRARTHKGVLPKDVDAAVFPKRGSRGGGAFAGVQGSPVSALQSNG